MNATLLEKDTTSNFSFDVGIEGKTYFVKIYLNEKGKFIDELIQSEGVELAYLGTEGEIREKILNYLDKHWDSLAG